MEKLSIINPNSIVEPFIYVDENYVFENEFNFNESKIKWKFYGMPYEHIPMQDGSIQTKYGFEYALGYIKDICNLHLKYDLIYGQLIERLDIDDAYDDYDDYDDHNNHDEHKDNNNENDNVHSLDSNNKEKTK